MPRPSSHSSPLLSTCWFSSLPTRASPLPCMGNRTADTFLCLCTGTGLPLARKFTDSEERTGRARNRQLDQEHECWIWRREGLPRRREGARQALSRVSIISITTLPLSSFCLSRGILTIYVKAISPFSLSYGDVQGMWSVVFIFVPHLLE